MDETAVVADELAMVWLEAAATDEEERSLAPGPVKPVGDTVEKLVAVADAD